MALIELLDPAYVKTRIDNLDVAISTRASESTLAGIKSKTDLLTFDTSNRLYVNVAAIVNPPNLDVALSTRASESTLSTLSGKFPSAVALADNLSNPTTTIIGGALLGFDGTNWRRIAADTSGRLSINVATTVNPPNLDVALSTRASESTLSALSGKFPTAVALGDTLSNPTTTIIGGALLGWDSAAGAWERIYTDGANRIKVALDSIPNPSNLDVALSTRASESTLSSLSGKFPSATALGDSLSNPTTTIVGSALLGFDGTNWRRVSSVSRDIDGTSRNVIAVIASRAYEITRMPYMVENVSVGTTESSTAISAPGAKYVKIVNKGDVDVLIGVNASVPTTNPLKVRPRTMKFFMFGGATAIYYKTATGSSTIDIEWWN